MYAKIVEYSVDGCKRFDLYDCAGRKVGCHTVSSNSPMALKKTRSELYSECAGEWVCLS